MMHGTTNIKLPVKLCYGVDQVNVCKESINIFIARDYNR